MDKDFVAATIQAIGRCATNIGEVRDTCLNGLVQLLSNRDGECACLPSSSSSLQLRKRRLGNPGLPQRFSQRRVLSFFPAAGSLGGRQFCIPDENRDACERRRLEAAGLSRVCPPAELVVAESVVVIKKLLQMQPEKHSDIIKHMAKLTDNIQVSVPLPPPAASAGEAESPSTQPARRCPWRGPVSCG